MRAAPRCSCISPAAVAAGALSGPEADSGTKRRRAKGAAPATARDLAPDRGAHRAGRRRRGGARGARRRGVRRGGQRSARQRGHPGRRRARGERPRHRRRQATRSSRTPGGGRGPPTPAASAQEGPAPLARMRGSGPPAPPVRTAPFPPRRLRGHDRHPSGPGTARRVPPRPCPKGRRGTIRRLLGGRCRLARAVGQGRRAAREGRGRGESRQRSERAALVAIGQELRAAEAELESSSESARSCWPRCRTRPDDTAPDGFSDEDALELRRVGSPPEFSFEPRDHLELSSLFGRRGPGASRASTSSAGLRCRGRASPTAVGAVALVELALYRYALDKLVGHRLRAGSPARCWCGSPPCTAPASCPPTRSTSTSSPSDGLYLTGTSEVALAALHQNEVLSADELPLRYAGYSTCFRREAGAAGRDTRGIFRVHQFDKVEMFFFAHPGALHASTTRRSSPSRRTSSAASASPTGSW